MTRKLISESPTVPRDRRTSTRRDTSAGTGSRPIPSKAKTPTSAPDGNARLFRNPPRGWLK